MSAPTQSAPEPEPDDVRVTPESVALDELFTRLYDRIRRLAARVRWNSSNPTLNPTALAHDAYLKLRKNPQALESKSYEEVISVFGHAMHQILIDAVRRKQARKRMPEESAESSSLPVEDLLTLAAGLSRLESENERQAQIVRSRFLLGMTAEETAAAMSLSTRTVERELQAAKTRLAALVRVPAQ